MRPLLSPLVLGRSLPVTPITTRLRSRLARNPCHFDPGSSISASFLTERRLRRFALPSLAARLQALEVGLLRATRGGRGEVSRATVSCGELAARWEGSGVALHRHHGHPAKHADTGNRRDPQAAGIAAVPQCKTPFDLAVLLVLASIGAHCPRKFSTTIAGRRRETRPSATAVLQRMPAWPFQPRDAFLDSSATMQMDWITESWLNVVGTVFATSSKSDRAIRHSVVATSLTSRVSAYSVSATLRSTIAPVTAPSAGGSKL